ncbi:MAG: outer membrane lipoprotein LolB [Rhodocyclaceae bacterium]|nr:outer membrane lipoprotein LolB [Rhodocyclaceae bacterium]
MIRILRLISVLLILAGCAAAPVLPQRPALHEIKTFTLTGRLSVRQGEQRHHLSLTWRHTQERDELLLTTPFGQGVAEIVSENAGARLKLADGREIAAADAAALAETVLGFRLPLAATARWLLGEVGETEGWTVRVLEREGEAPHALPTLIEFERGEIIVRLKIDAWEALR